ncbi:MAG: C39 family peptidase [Nitrosomonas sp.]|nr:C39 family peptidase [Nitrosomonas sp.]
MLKPVHHLPVRILPQPDETTCGPTCLHAIYDYWGKTDALDEIISRTRKLESGSGTFDVFLACDALRHGFQATIYTYNLMIFDPSWFVPGIDIAERLRLQSEAKTDRRLRYATRGYLEFLAAGGCLRFLDLSRRLIHGLLRRGLPILTGLSSTFLYRVAREHGPDDTPDDIRGVPAGHFVIISGYNRNKRTLLINDPYGPNQEYWCNIDRVINAILLGIVTYDSNLLVVHPPNAGDQHPGEQA